MNVLESTNLMRLSENSFPDIQSINISGNPTLVTPNKEDSISLRHTYADLQDIDEYVKFIRNSVKLFRGTEYYKLYKGHLLELGLDRCQVLGNLPVDTDNNDSLVTIEMNHVIITVFDVALIICETILKTYGSITSFELVNLLIKEHAEHRVPLVMMCKSVHQAYHADPLFFVQPNMIFGKWWELLDRYKLGITPEIASKVSYYCKKCQEQSGTFDNGLLQISRQVQEWGSYNNGFIDLDVNWNDDI